MDVVAIFGPTAVGKTGIAIEVAERLRERGEDPVAVGCDAIQVYRGLEVLSGAPTAEQRSRLEHRLVSIVGVDEEYSAGRYAERAHAEIDSLLERGRRPIVAGGTGLYLRAALAELKLRPPVPATIRAAVETEIAERGPAALHAELESKLAARIDPGDRKRIARTVELLRAGVEPPAESENLWTAELRHPARLFGLVIDRDRLRRRIGERVEAMVAAGAANEVRRADAAGASRTARAAIGFEELLAGDVEAMRRAQTAYARRQLVWMRKTAGVQVIDRGDRDDAEIAAEIIDAL